MELMLHLVGGIWILALGNQMGEILHAHIAGGGVGIGWVEKSLKIGLGFGDKICHAPVLGDNGHRWFDACRSVHIGK